MAKYFKIFLNLVFVDLNANLYYLIIRTSFLKYKLRCHQSYVKGEVAKILIFDFDFIVLNV